jgi:hypothetical protein
MSLFLFYFLLSCEFYLLGRNFMKDPAHHRKTVQKEVIRSSRNQPNPGNPTTLSVANHTTVLTIPEETSSLHPTFNSVARVNHDWRLDFDSKRKMPLDYIRHTRQRERMH